MSKQKMSAVLKDGLMNHKAMVLLNYSIDVDGTAAEPDL